MRGGEREEKERESLFVFMCVRARLREMHPISNRV
jgi:hypothetical protein